MTRSTNLQVKSFATALSAREDDVPARISTLRSVPPSSKNDGRANGWLAWPAADAGAQLRLFCFAYAGGAGTIFRPWRTQLPREVDVCAIQLPGRGARMYERHYRQLSTLVPVLAEAIFPLCDRPFAFFGHSLGSMIGYEVARYLRRETGCEPALFIAAGRRAPQIPSDDAPIYALPHDAFIAELRRLNGTPEEILLNQELMEMLLPTLRADFELCDTYRFEPGEPLTAPITVYGGADDEDESRDKLEAWQSVTSGSFRLRMFPGGHFFLHTAESLLLRTLSADLQDAITTLG